MSQAGAAPRRAVQSVTVSTDRFALSRPPSRESVSSSAKKSIRKRDTAATLGRGEGLVNKHRRWRVLKLRTLFTRSAPLPRTDSGVRRNGTLLHGSADWRRELGGVGRRPLP